VDEYQNTETEQGPHGKITCEKMFIVFFDAQGVVTVNLFLKAKQ
jgi:hypothetical protein